MVTITIFPTSGTALGGASKRLKSKSLIKKSTPDAVTAYSMRDGDVADGLNLKDERFDGRKEDDGELEHGIGLFSTVKTFNDHKC